MARGYNNDDVSDTKYKFSDSYRQLTPRRLDGLAAGYHFLGGWNAETDRRASKRAEGLQQFKDYVKTLTDNGIVPNQDSLNAFLGQAGDFGMNASYGFDPYAAQQMMQSAIKQGENRKREIAEQQIRAEADTNKKINEIYNLERGNHKTPEETVQAISERFPDLPPERFKAYSIGAEENWNTSTLQNIGIITKGVYDLKEADNYEQAHPNATDQQKYVYRQSIEANRTAKAKEIASALDPSIAQGKSDEEIRKIAKSRLDGNLQNDEDMITKVVDVMKGNALSEQAKATNKARDDIASNITKLHDEKIKFEQQRENERKAQLAISQKVFADNKKNRDQEKLKIEQKLADPKLKGDARISTLIQKAEIDYFLDPEVKAKLLEAKSEAEIHAILTANPNKVFSYDELQRVDERDLAFSHPTNVSSGYGTNKKVDYRKYVNNNRKYADILFANSMEAIQKDKNAGLSPTKKLQILGKALAMRLQNVRDGLASGGGHDYTPQDIAWLEQEYLGQYLSDKRLSDEDRKVIIKAAYNYLGEPPNIKKKLDPGTEYKNSLKDFTEGKGNPAVHESSYFNGQRGQGNVSTSVGNTGRQETQETPSIQSLWEKWGDLPKGFLSEAEERPTLIPVSNQEELPAESSASSPEVEAQTSPKIVLTGDETDEEFFDKAQKLAVEKTAERKRQEEEDRIKEKAWHKFHQERMKDIQVDPYDTEAAMGVYEKLRAEFESMWKAQQTATKKKEEKSIGEKILDVVVPTVQAGELDRTNPIQQEIWFDAETGRPIGDSPHVSELRKQPVAFFNSMRYDDPRLNTVATHFNVKYKLPDGLLNAVKNAGERSNNWQTPDLKKTGSTAKGVMQMTDTVRNKSKTKYGDLKHNPLNAVENIEAAAKLLASDYERIAKLVPVWSKANPLVATLIQYNAGTKEMKQYVKTGELDHLKKHQLAYVRRVLEYMQEHSEEEKLQFAQYVKHPTKPNGWDLVASAV